jgi:hypothetical protein
MDSDNLTIALNLLAIFAQADWISICLNGMVNG